VCLPSLDVIVLLSSGNAAQIRVSGVPIHGVGHDVKGGYEPAQDGDNAHLV
jgi:hypothetical protein